VVHGSTRDLVARSAGEGILIVIRTCLLVFGLLVFGCLGVSEASAATCPGDAYLWTGTAGDGSWNTAGNWNPAVVPPGGSDVCLPDIGHSYTVTLAPYGGSGGGTINSLTIGTPTGSDTETLDIVGQSYVYNGETQNGEGVGVTNGATINATGSLVLDATAGGGRALGSDTLGGPAAFGDSPSGGGAAIDNYGQIIAESSDYPTWDEQLNGDVTNEPGGNITVASGSLDQLTSNTVTNDGTVTTDSGGDYDVTSAGTNDIFTNDGTVANNGTFEVGGQTGTFTQDGPVTGNAMTIESGATLADQSGAGTFTLEYGSPVLTGTIAEGQTVNVRGASDIYEGETQNGTNLSLGGAALTNDGTLTLDATADGTRALQTDTLGGGVAVFDGTLTNNGTLGIKVDDPAWTNTLNASVENSHSGTATVAGGLNQGQGVNGIGFTNDGTVTLTPSALWGFSGGSTFTNAADGTLVPQIASATSFGSLSIGGTVTAAGDLTPTLEGGYTPSTGEEFDVIVLSGANFAGTFTGTFSTVGDGFTADYAHETASPAFVGVTYGSASSVPVVDPTATVVGCSPSSVAAGSAATCTGTVKDSASSGASTPTGTVAFVSAPTTGSFGTSGRCTLVATSTAGTASCSVTFTPSAAGGYTIAGSYGADSTHHTSFGTSSLTATTAGGGGGGTLGTVTIGSGAKVTSHGLASVRLTCSGAKGATCTGRLKLTVRVRTQVTRRIKGHRRRVKVFTTVQIGSAAYRLPAGKSETLGVKLSAPGVRLLDAARNRKLAAKATATASTGGSIATKTVTLTGPPRRKKTKK
jgi:fibronectin-binding autotransporter adhesin